jgi:hypothetical protein
MNKILILLIYTVRNLITIQMTKLFLSKDMDAERSYIAQKNLKKQILKDAQELCSKHITIDDMDWFKESFLGYVEKQVKEKINLPGITSSKIFELYDIPMMQIRKLESDYKRINIDLDGIAPSFDIYANTREQVEKAKQLQKLCDLLNDMQIKTDWLLIQRLFSQSILFVNDKWELNAYEIKNNF